jgi:LysM repeat protein
MNRNTHRFASRFVVVLFVVTILAISTPMSAFASALVIPTDVDASYGCWQYTVRRGDNLSRLAVRFDTTINAIQRANDLRGTKILIGQRLCIPNTLLPDPCQFAWNCLPPPPPPPAPPPFTCPFGWTCVPPVVTPPCTYGPGCVPQAYNPWDAEFFQGLDTINGPFIMKLPGFASTISFSWPTGSPYAGVPTTNWSVRLTQSTYMSAGDYNFWSTADDGVLVWVDKDMVINNWGNSPSQTASGTTHATLVAGQHTITIAYRHISGPGSLSVTWGAK